MATRTEKQIANAMRREISALKAENQILATKYEKAQAKKEELKVIVSSLQRKCKRACDAKEKIESQMDTTLALVDRMLLMIEREEHTRRVTERAAALVLARCNATIATSQKILTDAESSLYEATEKQAKNKRKNHMRRCVL